MTHASPCVIMGTAASVAARQALRKDYNVAGMSEIQVLGYLGRDPKVQYMQDGSPMINFSVAATKKWTDKSGGVQEKTNWFNVTCWGGLATTMEGLFNRGSLVKGKQVLIVGEFDLREYADRDGYTRTSADIRAAKVILTGSLSDSGGSGGVGRPRPANQPTKPADFNPDFIDVGVSETPIPQKPAFETIDFS